MKVSVIVPTLNRSALLPKAVSSIILQTLPAQLFEIIVVDNGSTDSTQMIVEELIAKHPKHRIRYVYEPEPGLLAGRHRGALEAIGDNFAFVDDDIEAVPEWLGAIVAGFDDEKVQLIGGRNLPKYEIEPPMWIESFWDTTPEGGRCCWYLSLSDFGQKKCQINPMYIWGLNFSIRRSTFFDLGGFHPECFPENLQRFDGDGESGLAMSARDRGLVAIYEPAAALYHFVAANRMTVEYFEKRAYVQGIRDSYSKVRREGIMGSMLGTRTRRLASRAISTTKRLGNVLAAFWTDEKITAEIHRRVSDAHQAGFDYHQRAVCEDPQVLKWVLRPHYWDYRLPH